jgi:transcriptional regulator with XRE-family HTH domain
MVCKRNAETEAASMRAAAWIAKAMAMAGVNQSELARRMGVQASYVSRMLKARNNMPIGTLFRAIDACGLEIVELRVRKKPN